ncbi:hypothetical protein [Fluviicola chungangensis]|uniref:Uncharacterized protein n=1 Tax=Fluviicola chungangensis TaxID=2597671 RepID=A0A556MY97_9FLAO|nr:hypothetical protein [Fluviicola chungangensis]TSJ44890.1 hypothetical protein FO442_09845 [Fluviicola chungangensis]
MLLSAQVFGAENPAYLYLKMPSGINTKKYQYRLLTNYVNKSSTRVGCMFSAIDQPGQLIICEVEDTLVDLQFIVKDRWGPGEYLHHSIRIQITADSVFYPIPELPDEAAIDAHIRDREKVHRKEQRRDGFHTFMTDWKSWYIYANFYQGNRPYGEVSFSNARYSDVPVRRGSLFRSRITYEPGLIRGPVYGAEFNFGWRKNDFILGPKIGFQMNGRLGNLGLSAVYYTDFTHGLVCLKPRIGINPGIPWVNFSYEYAIRCGYNYFGNRINSHQFSVYFIIPLRVVEFP